MSSAEKINKTKKAQRKAKKSQEKPQREGKPKVRKLTAKQESFVLEYLIDFNATQASIRAGYSRARASEIGWQLLQKTTVQGEITRLRQRDAERLGITREKALKELAVIAFSDIRQLFDENGNLLLPQQLPEEIGRAVSKYQVIEQASENGSTVRKTVALWDKKGALDSLAKHLGLFNGHDDEKDKDADKRLLILINQQTGPQINVSTQGEQPPGEAAASNR